MNWTPKILATLAAVAAVVVLGLWLNRPASSPPAPAAVTPAVAPATPPAARPTVPRQPVTTLAPSPVAVSASNAPAAWVTAAGTNAISNWETLLEEMLADETREPHAKGKQLLELLPRIPAAGQAETAQHIANLLADEDYAALASYFTNITTSIEVQEVILADLLGRPNSVKLPVLLDAARTPDHPKATDAREMLELYFEHDYGTDWDAWRSKMEEWLKSNPD